MGMVTVGTGEASQVEELLRQIGSTANAASDIRVNAAHWAGVVQNTMDRRDLQTVALVLLDASEDRTVPATQRRSARYWAANLGARI